MFALLADTLCMMYSPALVDLMARIRIKSYFYFQQILRYVLCDLQLSFKCFVQNVITCMFFIAIKVDFMLYLFIFSMSDFLFIHTLNINLMRTSFTYSGGDF